MPLFKPEDVNTPVLAQFILKGKIAAITGGNKCIGVEIVRGLAEAGADVALIYGKTPLPSHFVHPPATVSKPPDPEGETRQTHPVI